MHGIMHAAGLAIVLAGPAGAQQICTSFASLGGGPESVVIGARDQVEFVIAPLTPEGQGTRRSWEQPGLFETVQAQIGDPKNWHDIDHSSCELFQPRLVIAIDDPGGRTVFAESTCPSEAMLAFHGHVTESLVLPPELTLETLDVPWDEVHDPCGGPRDGS